MFAKAKPPLRGEVTGDGREKSHYVLSFSTLVFKVGTWQTYVEGGMRADGSGWIRVFRKYLNQPEQTVVRYEWQAERRAA